MFNNKLNFNFPIFSGLRAQGVGLGKHLYSWWLAIYSNACPSCKRIQVAKAPGLSQLGVFPPEHIPSPCAFGPRDQQSQVLASPVTAGSTAPDSETISCSHRESNCSCTQAHSGLCSLGTQWSSFTGPRQLEILTWCQDDVSSGELGNPIIRWLSSPGYPLHFSES